MEVMMKVPFWEAKFNMPREKAQEIVEKAFQYAAEREPGEVQTETRAPKRKPDGQRKLRGYKGFLIVKCGHCGKVRGFCSKIPIAHSLCDCGCETELHDLRAVHLSCKCGRCFTYKTNITEEYFDFPCFNCGNPVDLELNRHGNAYDTII